MASETTRVIVPGSERKAAAGARVRGAVAPDLRIEVTVRLRGRKPAAAAAQKLMALAARLPANRTYLTREEFARERGADPADVAKVEAFAHDHDLTVVRSNLAQRTLRLAGTAAALGRAFGVKMKVFEGRGTRYRGRTGPIYVPRELRGIVTGVHGLDNRPVAKPHFRRRSQLVKGQALSTRNAADGSLAVPDVARLYDFPRKLTGKGQCIALVELNDLDDQNNVVGTGFKTSDIRAFFKRLGLKPPKVVSIGVDGGMNLPGQSDSDGEVVLDIEVAGAVAPEATIAVYFAPNTTAGFINAVKAAVHDAVRKPSVVSISWGGPEDPGGHASPQFFQGLDEALQDAAAMGVTVCCAAGDDGSADMGRDWDGRLHADFPSSSPFALACGGTTLVGSGATVTSEVVWNEGRRGGAGGGGVSNFFARPPYQAKAKVPKSPKGKVGRGVPDVAGNADPLTGYQIFLDGKPDSIGGTSAVAPLVAGLIALINQRLQTVAGKKTAGFLNPLLYGQAASALRDIVTGNNDIFGKTGKYVAVKGWDACTGQGVPDGNRLLKTLAP